MVITDNIGTLASLIGSLTVVGSALLWIYNKTIGQPRERRRQKEEEKRQQNMLRMITEANDPLNKSIQQLTEWLNESKRDRERLDRLSKINSGRLDEHELRIDNHNDRLIVLEATNKFVQQFSYKGE